MRLRDRIAQRLARFITRHAVGCLIFTSLFGVTCATFFPRLQVRNDADDFILEKDPDHLRYLDLKKSLSRNSVMVVAFRNPDLFTPSGLTDLVNMTQALGEVKGVDNVLSLANVVDTVGHEDEFVSEPFLESIPTSAEELARLRQRAITDPIFRRQLVSEDGKAAALLVYQEDKDTPDFRKRILDNIQSTLQPYVDKGFTFHYAGWTVTSVYLTQYMNQDVFRFIPITLVLVLLTVWYVFRNPWVLFLTALGICFTVIGTLGLAAAAHIPLNNASVAVIPLVMTLALSDLVHLFSHLNQSVLQNHPGRRAPMNAVLRSILFPCFLTSLNTAIGFFTLTFNRVPAIRSFAYLASTGMLFEFLFSFFFIAPLAMQLRPEWIYRKSEERENHTISSFVRNVHFFVRSRPGWVVGACLGLLVLALSFAPRVVVDNNLIRYFWKSSPVRESVSFIDQNLAGTNQLSVAFYGQSSDTFKDPDVLERIDRIQKEIRNLPGVDTTLSLGDFFKEINKSFHNEDPAWSRLPASRAMSEQLLLLFDSKDLEEVVNDDFSLTRINLRCGDQSQPEVQELISQIRSIVEQRPITDVSIHVLGDLQDLVSTSHALIDDQLANIYQAVGSIWVVMLLVLRSFGLATLFLIPNLFPIALNFGIMGAFGIPINSSTALIASSAFGIVVDDTVHFFTTFQERLHQGLSPTAALDAVSMEKGEAVTSSFLILCIGFGVLLTSQFQPIFFFGLLNVVILLTGLIGDMGLLKAIMTYRVRLKKSSPS